MTPLLAGLAALAVTGTVGRVQRNAPELIGAALVLVLAAGVLWLVAGQIGNWEKRLRLLACGVALAGFLCGIFAAVSTANDEARPRVEAILSEDGKRLTGTVRASSLETGDRLNIVSIVFDETGKEDAEVIYSAYEGPDADGELEVPIAANLPPHPYTHVSVEAFTADESPGCNDQLGEEEGLAAAEESSGTGCVVVSIYGR